MPKIATESWMPVGIDSLEPDADKAVRSLENTIVVAGPGAGKTELLAQRACFLLQTGLCPSPHRILAISFKRDAAKNLRDRVAKRCGSQLARRFDSLTFDALAKSLLDRFLRALPTAFPLSADYEIRFDIERSATLRERLSRLAVVDQPLVNSIMRSSAEQAFYKQYVIGRPLAEDGFRESPKAEDRLALAFWNDALQNGTHSVVNFPMIGRLAELILRHNPRLLTALRYTYSFTFLDEFQDTTNIQYELTTTAFRDTDCVLTAVGDPKQRIMVWAGALDGIFARFEKDFGAKPLPLVMNYRSAPELVYIQRHLIAALDPHAPEPKPFHKDEKGKGECNIFVYDNVETEAQHIAEIINGILNSAELSPRDFCLLTRTWNDRYSALVVSELAKHGIKARVEKTLQDLLSEPLILAQIGLLRLALSERDALAWTEIVELLVEIQPKSGGESGARKAELRLAAFISTLRERIDSSDRNDDSIRRILDCLVGFLGMNRLKQCFPQYSQGSLFDDLQKQFAKELETRLETEADWLQVVNDIEGKDSVPIMTVHKSKGLEYHTVIFIGLEDSALWGFANAPEEEKCGFFVAFSRAITRVVFTFCKTRPRSVGGYPEKQSNKTIGVLYQLLQAAGVKAHHVPGNP